MNFISENNQTIRTLGGWRKLTSGPDLQKKYEHNGGSRCYRITSKISKVKICYIRQFRDV